jgi:hypothetical protein
MKKIISRNTLKLAALFALGSIAGQSHASLIGQTISYRGCFDGSCGSVETFVGGSTVGIWPGFLITTFSASDHTINILNSGGGPGAVAYAAPTPNAYHIGGLTLHNGILLDIGQQITYLQPFDSWMNGRITYSGSLIAIEMQDLFYGPGSNFSMNINAVPVPAAAWLFGSGLLGLGAAARRRKVA